MPVARSSLDEARQYAGPERRGYPRISANYPICVRLVSSSGEMIERYAQTRNVSAKGILFSCLEALEIGIEVDILMGIPSAYAASLPAAQLTGEAVVVRCEPIGPLEDEGIGARVALKFLKMPKLTTELSMFD